MDIAVPHAPARDVRFLVATVVVALWAVFQNLYRIGQQFVLFDEGTYANAAWRYVHGDVLAPAHHPDPLHATPDNFEHPPLAKLLFGLAQLVPGHASVTADRVVAAGCTLLTAVVLGAWLSRLAGRWTGLLAGAFVALLPAMVSGADVRFARYGMLDPVASLFMVVSLAAGWTWMQRRGPSSWRWAVLTGVAVGCATAAKENGFLGIVGPVLLLVGLVARDRRLLLIRSAQALTAAAAAVLVLLATYLPVGHPVDRLEYLLRYGAAHTGTGHLIGFAGRISHTPPWWTNLWFAGHGFGAVLVTVLVLAALSAVALRRDLLVAWLLAALAVPVVFHLFIATVVLAHYWTLWTPAFVALAALGVHALAVHRSKALALVAAALLIAPLSSAVAESTRVAGLEPEGTAVLGAVMREHALSGPVVVAGLYSFELYAYGPRVSLLSSGLSSHAERADTVVVGRPRCRLLIDPSVRALVAVNLKAGRLRQVHRDSRIEVYAGTGPLRLPTPVEVAAQPVGALADHC